MRPVMVSQVVWTPYVPASGNEPAKPSQKTMLELGTATFHQFGTQYEEFENGPGNYTVAIVEWPGGRVEMVTPECIRFLDAPGGEPVERRTFTDIPGAGCEDFAAQVTVRRVGDKILVEDLKLIDPRTGEPSKKEGA